MLGDLASASKLARDAGALADEQHHRVNSRTTEVDRQWRVGKLVMERADFVHQQLQKFDLHRGARKAVENHAIPIGFVEQLAQQHAQHFPVADHPALCFDLLHLRRRQQIADDDRRTGQATRLADESGLRALSGARCAAEEDDLLWKTQVLPAGLLLQGVPGLVEDDAGLIGSR